MKGHDERIVGAFLAAHSERAAEQGIAPAVRKPPNDQSRGGMFPRKPDVVITAHESASGLGWSSGSSSGLRESSLALRA